MVRTTKPQTLAYGLNDSPVGLAAWIGEKFFSWSDARGDMAGGRFAALEVPEAYVAFLRGAIIELEKSVGL
jgi:hypothetical protein